MFSIKNIFNRKNIIKGLGVMLGMMLVVPAFASLAVSPTRLEINANKIKGNYFTTAIDIKGDVDRVMRFKAYPGYFKINDKGEVVLLEGSNEPYDISKKLRFVPSEFTVSPGRSQKLRVNITGLNSLVDGENRAILFIEDVNPKELNIPTPREGIGAQLIVKSRIGIPIYIDKGKFVKEAELVAFDIVQAKDGLYVDMKIASKGNSKVRYTTSVQIINGKKLVDEFNLIGSVVSQGSTYSDRQKLDTSKVTESGEYTVRVIVSYFDENGRRKNIKKEKNINIVGKM